MFFRKKPEPPAPTTAANVESPRTRDRKGHATPTRKEAQAARQRPLVIEDRKAAKVAAQQARFEQQQKVNQAMQTGDERYLPQWDKGKARRFARDYVDARFSIGEFFIPLALVVMVLMVVAQQWPELAMNMTLGLYIFIFVGMIDAIIMSLMLIRLMRKYFAEGEIPKGTAFYAFRRVFIMRRWRTPRPLVARGEWPQNKAEPTAV